MTPYDPAAETRTRLGLDTRDLPARLRYYLAQPDFQAAVLAWPASTFESLRDAPSDADHAEAEALADKAASGDDHAKLRLAVRYLRFAEAYAFKLTSAGNTAAADADDVVQTVLTAALSVAAEGGGCGRPVLDRTYDAIRDAVRTECAAYARSSTVPTMTLFRYLKSMSASDGDVEAAWTWNLSRPAGDRIADKDTFLAAHAIVTGRREMPDDVPEPDHADATTDRVAVEQALSALAPDAREALERSFGLNGYYEQTTREVALAMNLSRMSAHRLIAAARDDLAALLSA